MKSIIAALCIGVATGAVVSNFAVFDLKRTAHPSVTSDASALMTSPIEIRQSGEVSSPFALVTENTGAPDKFPASLPITNLNAVVSESGSLEISISGIEHYSEAIEYLHHIDVANIDELTSLLMQLHAVDPDLLLPRMLHTAIYQRFGEIDIDAALDHAIQMIESHDSEHSTWSHEALSILASLDPEYVQQKIEQLEGISPNSVLKNSVHAQIAVNDPELFARQFIDESANSTAYRIESFSLAMSEWAMEDPESAWRFMLNEADHEIRFLLAEPILNIWFDLDPDAASVEIEALLHGDSVNQSQRTGLTSLYLSHLSKTNPEAVGQWTVSQNDAVLRDNALLSVIDAWDKDDTYGLEILISGMGPETRDRIMPVAAAAMVPQSFFELDPEEARAWLDAQLVPEVRELGSVFIRAMDPDADTNTVLENIASLPGLQGRHSQVLLFDAITERLTIDQAAVMQWISKTSRLDFREKEFVQQMAYEANRFGMPVDYATSTGGG